METLFLALAGGICHLEEHEQLNPQWQGHREAFEEQQNAPQSPSEHKPAKLVGSYLKKPSWLLVALLSPWLWAEASRETSPSTIAE